MKENTCNIVSVGKRRDGGTRYWCLAHKADATAKYGVAADTCRYAHVSIPSEEETLKLSPDKYPGGIALWGAVPPIYDTTSLPIDRGIHVHAREKLNGDKIIDKTYRRVQIIKDEINPQGSVVDELDAIYYMVSTVLGKTMSVVICTRCGYSHLDKDWFSANLHQRHLCSGCGYKFSDTKKGIGNPLVAIRNLIEGVSTRSEIPAGRKLKIEQKDYPLGIQIWGSNPAIVWTSQKSEEQGIHVHAYKDTYDHYSIDNTYDVVEIDGIKLDAVMVRTLMAQNCLPHIKNRVKSELCPHCGQYHFDVDELVHTPHDTHLCEWCGKEFKPKGRLRKTISNPMIATLELLAKNAVMPPQRHDIGLLPETI